MAAETVARFVEDSKDIETVEGAGTIGLELAGDQSPFDAVLVPLGNGSLLNGIATAMKARSAATQMVAVQATGAPAMIESWRNRSFIESESIDTIADGIAVRVPVPEALDDMAGIVDEGLLVDDREIIEAMQLIHRHAGLVVEPSGAIGVAAAKKYGEKYDGKRIATVICGSNLTAEQMRAWL